MSSHEMPFQAECTFRPLILDEDKEQDALSRKACINMYQGSGFSLVYLGSEIEHRRRVMATSSDPCKQYRLTDRQLRRPSR